jgi:hypothetical protein
MGEEQGEFCLQEDFEPVTTHEKAVCSEEANERFS